MVVSLPEIWLEAPLCSKEKELYSVSPWGQGQKKGARFFLGVIWLKEVLKGYPLVGSPGGEPFSLAALREADGLRWMLSPTYRLSL